jgi:hypothetical protein
MTMMNGSLRQAGDSMAADAVKAKDSNLQGNRVKETRDKRLKC